MPDAASRPSQDFFDIIHATQQRHRDDDEYDQESLNDMILILKYDPKVHTGVLWQRD